MQVEAILIKLREKPEIDEGIKTAANATCEQIVIACKELEMIKNSLNGL